MNQLKEKYRKEIAPELAKEFGIKNIMAIPYIEKVTINVSLGEATGNAGVIDKVLEQITLISGQKPIATKAKKSISTFKLRQGQAIGVKVTLRGERMYDFLDRLFNIVLPRVRDFRGISDKAFDKEANFSLGIKEQILFPEIEYSQIDKVRGLQVTLTTSTKEIPAARKLLEALGMPFEKIENN